MFYKTLNTIHLSCIMSYVIGKWIMEKIIEHCVRISCVMLFILLFMSFGISYAATYYVAVKGNDSNKGDLGHPWRTIQKAANILRAGDTAIVNPGTYDEHVTTRTSGVSGKLIQFTTNGTVSMRGFTVNHDYIRIDGFKMEGEYKIYDGFISVTGSNNVISNNNIVYSGSSKIYGIMLGDGSSRCTIQNNALDGLVYPNIQLRGSFHMVENNTIKNTPHDAMRVFGNGHIIRGNFFNHVNATDLTHTDIIQTFGVNGDVAFDIIFESNYIKDCKAQIGNFEQHGIEDIRDWTFRNNVFENVSMQANIYAPGFKWYNNTFYHVDQNTGGPLFFNAAESGRANNGMVENNLFIDCGRLPNNTGWYSVDSGITGFQADYNYVARGPSNNWSDKTGFREPHGINGGNPKFINHESSDFRLQADSPAVNSGVTIGGFHSDKNGIPRPQRSAWDMGAYETQ